MLLERAPLVRSLGLARIVRHRFLLGIALAKCCGADKRSFFGIRLSGQRDCRVPVLLASSLGREILRDSMG